MRVLVIGGSGRIGAHVVERAIGHGHEIRCLVHDSRPTFSAPVELADGDALDFDDVSAVVDGMDAVIVAISGRSGSGPIHEPAIANVVYAMALHGVTRLAVVSAAGAFARNDRNLSLPFRLQLRTTLSATYDDLEAMEMRIAASALDWTIVRPVGLTDDEASGHYRVTLDGRIPRKPKRIPRADIAAVLLKSVETSMFSRRRIVISG